MNQKFIVFEGLDHVGKTTQIDRAEEYLKSLDIPVVRFREPGGTKAGEEIRALLLKQRAVDLNPKTELMLFFAARFQLIETEIRPALAAGKTVLLDRYYYSSAAYQGPFSYGAAWVTNMAEEWLRLLQPDAVLYLDGDPEILAKRAHGEGDRIEAKGIEFQKKVRSAYLDMVDQNHLFYRIDAEKSIDSVWGAVQHGLDMAMGRK